MKRAFGTRKDSGVLRFIEAVDFCFILALRVLHICEANASFSLAVLFTFHRFYGIIKRSESASLLVSERVQIAPRAFCKKQNKVRSTTSQEVKLARSII